MKKKTKIILLALITVLSFTACKKNDSKDIEDNNLTEENKDNKEDFNKIEDKKESDEVEDKKDDKDKNSEEDDDDKTSNENIIFELKKDSYVYKSAEDAKKSINPQGEYKAGTYYIFKDMENIINISKEKNKAGGWININSNKKPGQDKNNLQSKTSNKPIKDNKGDTIKNGIYYLSVDSPVYKNIDDAKSRVNSVTSYKKGQYYIYKQIGNIYNISMKEGEAGGWLESNPKYLPGSNNNTKPPTVNKPNKPSKPSNNNSSYKGLSNKSYSWSWGYPDSSGAHVLNKLGGIYRMNPNSKNIYLTFDLGYEYKNNTEKILDILSENNVKAVFFTTVDYMKQAPNTSRRIVNEGHIMGNHTVKHLNHPAVSTESVINDIKGWENYYVSMFGAKPQVKLFRPPEGKFSEKTVTIAKDLGYKTVLWSYGYNDWDVNNQPNKVEALDKLNNNTKAGFLPLLHSISNTNVSILDEYIKNSKSKGYSFNLIY